MKFALPGLLAFLSLTASAQLPDYIISLKGDTIPCRILPDPRAEKIRIKRSEGRNGYRYVVAEFGGDSMRILRPEQIRGFFKESPHRRMGNGHYVSVVEGLPQGTILQRGFYSPEPLFFRVLVNGSPYRLYQFNDWDGQDVLTFYWIENRATGDRQFVRLPDLRKWTENCPDSPAPPPLPRGLRNEFGRMQQLVKLANLCQPAWPPANRRD
jgi:hypothetical protein